ncbi:MAG: hypothetical protein WD512_17430, partial [Candidatus Paceibacterota bacterium]
FGKYVDEVAMRLNMDVKKLGQDITPFPNRPIPNASEALPGYRPFNQARPVGMSTQPIEPVGFGKKDPTSFKTADDYVKAQGTPVKEFVLPKEISTYEEAKMIGAKRIAPDRIAHQQLTPEQGIKSLVEKEKAKIINNSNSWRKVAEKVQGLFDKYGDKMPARTEASLLKYPSIMDDFRTYSDYKKYSTSRGLEGMKNEFLARADRIKWTPEGEAKAIESAKKNYVDLIKSDISKGYKYPDEVLDYDKSFKTAVDNRERYEKGLRTSFSSDDARIDTSEVSVIGGGVKRQDGKIITPEQKQSIKTGVIDFSNAMGLDIPKIAKDDRWVYAHLNGKNPFLMKNAAGLYRKGADNVSISVGGSETFKKIVDGKEVVERVHTTMAHELGHALDGKVKGRFFDSSTLWKLKYNFNDVSGLPRGDKYWKSESEITARMIEQYNAVKKGNNNLFDRAGYWKKDIYEKEITPAVEEAITKHFSEYKVTRSQLIEEWNKENKVSLKLKTEGKYKIADKSGIKEVEGKPVEINKELDTFIHKDENGNWSVSEKNTGRNISGGGHKIEKNAIDYAKSMVDEIGIEKFKEQINKLKLENLNKAQKPSPVEDVSTLNATKQKPQSPLQSLTSKPVQKGEEPVKLLPGKVAIQGDNFFMSEGKSRMTRPDNLRKTFKTKAIKAEAMEKAKAVYDKKIANIKDD